jgi:hypothetical protein
MCCATGGALRNRATSRAELRNTIFKNQEPSADKKVAIKQLLFAANQVVFISPSMDST